MTRLNRRDFLAGSAASIATTSGMVSSLAIGARAMAADTSGYKALVCLFLKGGIDGMDTILPVDQTSYNQLEALREEMFASYNSRDVVSRLRNNILPLSADNSGDLGGRTFGMPQEMTGLHQLFEDGELAVLGNVGPLIEPTDRTSYDNGSVRLPARLFSHNDQQSTWMALGVEGEQRGWGGLFAEAASASDPSINPLFAAITARSNDVFLEGEAIRQFRASAGSLDILTRRRLLGTRSSDNVRRERVREFLTASGSRGYSGLYEQDLAASVAGGITNTEFYRDALDTDVPAGLTDAFPSTGLAGQLASVAESIAIRNTLGISRQVFYVTLGGFDTHAGQAGSLPGRQTEIADAVVAFRQAMLDLGVWNDVTLFSMSDFGRTTLSNDDGTDHGWGNHHFITGGAVNGRSIYGEMPNLDLDGERYTGRRGRLIPTTSVEEYAATLGRWFGLGESELDNILPNLANFSSRDLGFMDCGSFCGST